ncbi:hypothetical protein CVT26_012041 [Gymnopilus dilepis]|uniref:Uncharacterized protein n=1 Tax=Gymnopilus dilepis TaxID=231916 RepID=A0A409VYG0_9AGAR|nr:hypothetical protein CVT26_012041 [Gymnopilus dilepis]
MSNRNDPHDCGSLSFLKSPVPHLLETNRVPSDEERKKIVDFLPLAKDRARRLQEQLDKSSATSDSSWFEDIRALCETEAFICKHEGYLSAIHNLPNEILVLIFLACLPDVHSTPLCPAEWYTISSFRLSQVCQTWRDLALCTPLLWVNLIGISLHSSLPPRQEKSYLAFIKTLLARSGDHDLQLCISTTPMSHFQRDHPVLALLIQHQHRWSALDLRCGIDFVQAMLENGQPSSPMPPLSLPNLRWLRLILLDVTNTPLTTINVARFHHLDEVTILHPYRHLRVLLSSKHLRVYKEVFWGEYDYDPWRGPISSVKELGRGLEEMALSTKCAVSFSREARAFGGEPPDDSNSTFATLENLTTLALRLYDPPSLIYSIPTPSVIDAGWPLSRLKILKLTAPATTGNWTSHWQGPRSHLPSLIPLLLPFGHLQRLHLKRVTLLGGDLCRILALTPSLEELIMDLPCATDLEQLAAGLSNMPAAPNVGSKASSIPKLRGLAIELNSQEVNQLISRTNESHCLLLLGPAIVADCAQNREPNQDDHSVMPYFRLIFPDIRAARNVQLSFNMSNYRAADHSLGSEELDPKAKKALRQEVYRLKAKFREAISKVMNSSSTKPVKSKESRRRGSRSDFASDLNNLLAKAEGLKLRQGRRIANLYITSLHLSVRYLSRLEDGVLPEDDKYLFRQRASLLLSRWDEIMLVDLKVRKLEWALKGRRSLVYLPKSDELHALPQIKDAVYDGLEDDMARFNEFIWPDSTWEY